MEHEIDPLDVVRVPDVEDAVLGCLLLSPSLLSTCDVQPEDFTSADKRTIFGIIKRLGLDADVATVASIMRREVSAVPLSMLAELMESVPSDRGFQTYCRQLRALRTAGSTCGGKPVVMIPGQHHYGGGEVCVGTDHFAERVLASIPDGTLYRRGNDVGTIVGEPGRRRFDPLTSDGTRRLVDSYVTLFAAKPGETEPAPAGEESARVAPGDKLRFAACSRDLGGLVADAARSHRNVRDLVMLTTYPVYRRDWTLSPPGYSDGVYYDEPPDLIGLAPDGDEWPVLDDALIDFPFKDESSRFNMIGLILTPIIRHAVGNVPFHLIHSSMERTGKTKLVELLGRIVLGEALPAIQVSEREEETEKRITSAMRAGKPVLFFDNLGHHLDSPSLAALATSAVWEGRTLGKSELATYPNRACVVMTGNNVRATGELVKRTVPILLQPATARPEDRQDFRHPDLSAWLAYHRRRIWSAILGGVQRWIDCGRPAGAIRFGGFEEWAAAVGGILEGSPWLQNARDWRRQADPHSEDLSAFVGAWWASRGNLDATAAYLAEIAKNAGLFGHLFTREGPGSVVSFARRVLSPSIDRPVAFGDESFIIRRKGSGSSSFWRLDRA